MTDDHDRTESAGGWRSPEPASEATFAPPPRPADAAPAPALSQPTATDPSATPGWLAPETRAPAWPSTAAGYAQAGGWSGAAAPPRSTSMPVVVSAVFLLATGLLLVGMAALLLLGSALFAGAGGSTALEEMVGGDLASALAGVFAIVGAFALGASLLQIVGAIGMLAHRSWGRAIGLVVGVLGLLFWGLSFLAGLNEAADAGLAVTGLLVAGYGLTVVALVTGGTHFRRA